MDSLDLLFHAWLLRLRPRLGHGWSVVLAISLCHQCLLPLLLRSRQGHLVLARLLYQFLLQLCQVLTCRLSLSSLDLVDFK